MNPKAFRCLSVLLVIWLAASLVAGAVHEVSRYHDAQCKCQIQRNAAASASPGEVKIQLVPCSVEAVTQQPDEIPRLDLSFPAPRRGPPLAA